MKKNQTKMLKKIEQLKAVLVSALEENQEFNEREQLLCAVSSRWLDKEILFDEEVEFPEFCGCYHCLRKISEIEAQEELIRLNEAEADLAERERLLEENLKEIKRGMEIQEKLLADLEEYEKALLEEKDALEKVVKEMLKVAKSLEGKIAGNSEKKGAVSAN